MFGIVVSGRPVLTAFEKLSETQIKFTIPSQPHFNHLVVFLLPGAALPADAAAACYLQLSPNDEYKLLGALSNDKQSAIFKIRTTDKSMAVHGVGVIDEDLMTDNTEAAAPSLTLGISLEPAVQVQANLAAMKATQPAHTTGQELVRSNSWQKDVKTALSTKTLAQRIIANAFNFLASFASGGSNDVVPLKAFKEWWTKFEKKIEMDPTFLEREQG